MLSWDVSIFSYIIKYTKYRNAFQVLYPRLYFVPTVFGGAEYDQVLRKLGSLISALSKVPTKV